jgi:hypothetical protein
LEICNPRVIDFIVGRWFWSPWDCNYFLRITIPGWSILSSDDDFDHPGIVIIFWELQSQGDRFYRRTMILINLGL